MTSKPKLRVRWMRCGDDRHWCDFQTLKLSNKHFDKLKGVYVIFSENEVVRLGSGIIKDRIAAHRTNPDITAHKDLQVTWAEVDARQMEGVEKYLANELKPKIGSAFPDRTPIPVNLPW